MVLTWPSIAMKKKIKIKIPPIDILKETPEQRKERVNSAGSAMFSKVVPSKKKLSNKQQRQKNKKEVTNSYYV